ncbi:tripartite tricarboxylate transporter substrate binding protein [Polaromonas sp. P1(28)-8]|nr:tripartite tricarboxylate transporter substrate binding protein [Polaromonas sp. P1(28)-8]
MTRLMANEMSNLLKQPIIVDNRVGAGGTIASNYVAKAQPDGYTLHTMDVCGYTSVQHLYSNLPYSPPKDIKIVSLLVRQPFVLVVNANSAAKTYQELVALAKKEPGKLNYGSSGVGTPLHIAMEMFQVRSGIKLAHVPYKAMVSMMTDLVSGQVEVALGDYGSLKPFIQNGKLRPLAVAMDARIAALPDVPTFDELGVKNLPVSVWLSLATPAGVPAAIVDKLAVAAKDAVLSPAVRDKLANVGIEPFVLSGKDAATFLSAQVTLWAEALKPLNIRID